MSNNSIGPIDKTQSGATRAMAMKEYSGFPKAPALRKPYHQIVSCHIQDTCWGVLPLCRDAVSGFYGPNRLDQVNILLVILFLNESELICLHTSIAIICTLLNSFKYCHLTLKQFLVKQFYLTNRREPNRYDH